VHCQPPVFQPIRAKHCFACNRCVRKFDHHCHWISNCVGEKNHGKFLVFLTTQFIVVAWGLLACTRTFEYYSSSSSRSSSSSSSSIRA
jgi:palmitoyltransferase